MRRKILKRKPDKPQHDPEGPVVILNSTQEWRNKQDIQQKKNKTVKKPKYLVFLIFIFTQLVKQKILLCIYFYMFLMFLLSYLSTV